jgi:DNA-directed RNA polymerase specialized sigma24 family protein
MIFVGAGIARTYKNHYKSATPTWLLIGLKLVIQAITLLFSSYLKQQHSHIEPDDSTFAIIHNNQFTSTNFMIDQPTSMTAEEALALLDNLFSQKLKTIQEMVFHYTWQGLTYTEIARRSGYNVSHIRDTGYELWQQLSQTMGERVTKKNLRAVLRREMLRHSQNHASS